MDPATKKQILANIRAKWKILRQDEGNKTPVSVKINGKKTTCQRKIVEKYSKQILKKIDNEKKNILDKRENTMDIFKSLITRVEDELLMKEVTYKEVYKVV